MSKKTYRNEPKGSAPIEEQMVYDQLKRDFEKYSTFSLRWKDFISPGMNSDTFIERFSRKARVLAYDKKWIDNKRYYTGEGHTQRIGVIFVACELPQTKSHELAVKIVGVITVAGCLVMIKLLSSFL